MRVIVRKYVEVLKFVELPDPFDSIGGILVDKRKGDPLFTTDVYEDVKKFSNSSELLELYFEDHETFIELDKVFNIKIEPENRL